MPNYFIVTDACANLPKKFYEDDFAVIPMDVVINGQIYDADKMDKKSFYNMMRDGATPSTSLINTQTAIDFFTPILEKGNDIFFVCFSSALSGTYRAMLEAQTELKKSFPERNVYILDSRAASGGEGFFVYYCLKKRREGMTMAELITWAEDFKNVCHHDFTVSDLKNLVRGGRLTKAVAIVGTAMQVKPVLIVNPEGELIPISKVVGRKMALKAMIDKMVEKSEGIDNSELVYIEHSDCEQDALFLKQKIEEKFNYKNIEINYISPIIGSHLGPDALTLFYIGKDKNK